MRARGLKLAIRKKLDLCSMSRPMRARGLKLALTNRVGTAVRRAPCGRVD